MTRVGIRTRRQASPAQRSKHRIKGLAEQKAKELGGKMTGDTKTETEGKADQVKGKVQNIVGGMKDKMKEKKEDDAA